jgi:hypothetical protein
MGGTFSDRFAKWVCTMASFTGLELDNFGVWVDANYNAKVDKGEVQTLADVGVHSLITMHNVS